MNIYKENIDNLQKERDFLKEKCSKFYGWEDDCSLGYRRFKCRRCDFAINLDEIEIFRFCPICGANNWYTKGLLHDKVSYDVSEVFPWQKFKHIKIITTSEDYKRHIENKYGIKMREVTDETEEQLFKNKTDKQ